MESAGMLITHFAKPTVSEANVNMYARFMRLFFVANLRIVQAKKRFFVQIYNLLHTG